MACRSTAAAEADHYDKTLHVEIPPQQTLPLKRWPAPPRRSIRPAIRRSADQADPQACTASREAERQRTLQRNYQLQRAAAYHAAYGGKLSSELKAPQPSGCIAPLTPLSASRSCRVLEELFSQIQGPAAAAGLSGDGMDVVYHGDSVDPFFRGPTVPRGGGTKPSGRHRSASVELLAVGASLLLSSHSRGDFSTASLMSGSSRASSASNMAGIDELQMASWSQASASSELPASVICHVGMTPVYTILSLPAHCMSLVGVSSARPREGIVAILCMVASHACV